MSKITHEKFTEAKKVICGWSDKKNYLIFLRC